MVTTDHYADVYTWPEVLEEGDIPSFVSDTGEAGDWHPVCDDCGERLRPLRRNPMANFECANYYGNPEHGLVHLYLIWAEDWPDYEEPCDLVHDGYDTDGSEWSRCTTHDLLVFGPPDNGPYSICEEGQR